MSVSEVENWKEVVGFSGYEVSDLGNVRTIRYWNKTGRELNPTVDALGYKRVGLRAGKYGEPGYKVITRSVHSLVLEAFVGPRPVGAVGRHFPDRNPSNCRLDNLSWSTQK